MNKLFIATLFITIFYFNLNAFQKSYFELENKNAAKELTKVSNVKIVTFLQLQQQAENKKNDTLYVLNFWATWCKPCIEEIPFFEEASRKFVVEKIKIIYVSLNSVKEIKSVQHFITTQQISNTVLLLNATNPNDWIDKIDSSWSGAIPATVMYKNGKKVFFKEGDFTQEEIILTINKNK